MDKFDVVCIGEAMAEIRQLSASGVNTNFGVGFAGDTFNTAVYCKRRLGDSGTVAYLTQVGEDPLSLEFVRTAKREGLDTSHIATDDDRSIGIYSIATDNKGERSFTYWRDQSAARHLFFFDEPIELPKAKLYYLSGITLAILSPHARVKLLGCLSRIANLGHSLIAFDSNYRQNLWESETVARQTIGDMWKIANVALPSMDDEITLFGDASQSAVSKRFFSRQWHSCVIKRGRLGPITSAMATYPTGMFPAAPMVVDTTAAGDSFNGAYLACLLQGKNELSCLEAGHRLAVEVIGKSGAIIPQNEHDTSKENG